MTITSIERQAIAALAAIFSLRMLGLFMIFPVFSLYANQLNDATPTLIGIALGIYGLTQALLQIPFGYASDRFGRKPVMTLGLILFVLGSVLAAISNSIYGVIVGRCLQGGSAIGCVIMALVADLTREEIRVRAMAIIGITIGFSFALAMLLGPLLSEVGGIKGIFWMTALLALLAIWMLNVCVPTPISSTKEEVLPILNCIPSVLANPNMRQLIFGILVLHASLVGVFLKVPQALKAFGFADGETWRFYLPVFVASLLATGPCLWIVERERWVKYGIAGMVTALVLSEWGMMHFFHHSTGLALCLGVFFTAFNTLEASLPSLVPQYVPIHLKGTALGIYSSAQFLGLFAGGVVGGWLDTGYGMVGVLVFCVLIAVIWLTWILQAILKERFRDG